MAGSYQSGGAGHRQERDADAHSLTLRTKRPGRHAARAGLPPSVARNAIAMTSSPHHPDPAAGAPRLGVGLLYNRALAEFLQHELDGLDFVEIIPDLLRT